MSSLIISLISSLGLYSLLKCPHVLCNLLMLYSPLKCQHVLCNPLMLYSLLKCPHVLCNPLMLYSPLKCQHVLCNPLMLYSPLKCQHVLCNPLMLYSLLKCPHVLCNPLMLYSPLKCQHVLCNPLMSAHILLNIEIYKTRADENISLYLGKWNTYVGAIRCNNETVSASMCRWVNGLMENIVGCDQNILLYIPYNSSPNLVVRVFRLIWIVHLYLP